MNWNRRLFFAINRWVGKYSWLDMLGRWSAEYAIIVLLAWYGGVLFLQFSDSWYRLAFLIFLSAVAWVAAWILNVAIGLVVSEPRPHMTNPSSKLLFTPLMSWKSFPSDHAMSAWLFVWLGIAFMVPGWPVLVTLALIVSWGRVFAGVHYPLDIVGGFIVAGLVVQLGRLFLF